MKKKIVFMSINMNVGGTEKALLNMLSEIPKDKYDITLLLLEEYGGFLNHIPRGVRVKYLEGYKKIKNKLNQPPKITMLELVKKGQLINAIKFSFIYTLSKIMSDKRIFFKYLLSGFPKLNDEYDLAVAYAGPMDFISYFVVNKIKSSNKIQWIHFDITKIGFDRSFALKIYSQFNKIFVVSKEGRSKLVDFVPALREKTDVFSNIISSQLINAQTKEGIGFKDNFDGLRILTVGRLSFEKGQDIAIRVLQRLIKNGYKVRWYCLGDGSYRTKYETLVHDYNLQEEFIFMGSDPNPYSYIEQCDIYVQPSRHEGYCITLAEARCLKKPIITTDFTGAKEQIKHEETGLVVSIDENEIYNAVTKLIHNRVLGNTFSANLSKETFNSTRDMEKIYALI